MSPCPLARVLSEPSTHLVGHLRVFLFLTRVHHDAPAADGLALAVVVDVMLYAVGILPQDAYAEGVGGGVSSPQHELVGVSVGIQYSVDRAAALKLGIDLVPAYHQSFVGVGKEVE